jgi:hypothetical protein
LELWQSWRLESSKEEAMPQDHQNERPKSPPQGDDRTPDKTQGQIKYAQGQKKEGGEPPSAVPNRDPAKKKTGEF